MTTTPCKKTRAIIILGDTKNSRALFDTTKLQIKSEVLDFGNKNLAVSIVPTFLEEETWIMRYIEYLLAKIVHVIQTRNNSEIVIDPLINDHHVITKEYNSGITCHRKMDST